MIQFLAGNHLVAKNRSLFKEALIKRKFIIIIQRNFSSLHCIVQTGLFFLSLHTSFLSRVLFTCLSLSFARVWALALTYYDLSALVLVIRLPIYVNRPARRPLWGPQGHWPDPVASRYWPNPSSARPRLAGSSTNLRADRAFSPRLSSHQVPDPWPSRLWLAVWSAGSPSPPPTTRSAQRARARPPPLSRAFLLAGRVAPASQSTPRNLRRERAYDLIIRTFPGQRVLRILGRRRPGKSESGRTGSPQWKTWASFPEGGGWGHWGCRRGRAALRQGLALL